ncbi:MAG: DUF1203 domain-containing protein [Rhodobacteraceae bacterium]|nr:DUF1203 domain-containing protein [Paracoccaceae bacterium]
MRLEFQPIPTATVAAIRAGGPDANGQPAERGHVSDGTGVPCRHCLRHTPAGRGYLILAHRPFPAPQPYAETGPVFLCEDACEAWSGEGVPEILRTAPDYLIKAYSADHRIVYGTGRIVARDALEDRAAALFADPRIAFVDVRSARNNCFQTRILRAAPAAAPGGVVPAGNL